MTLIQLMFPSTRPNDWADVRSGLSYMGALAGLSSIPLVPGPEVPVLAAHYKWGIKGSGPLAVAGLGVAFIYGIHKSNVKQSMGGQDVASQHAGSLIAEITNSGPSALSPHGSSVLPKGRRTVQARKGSQNFSRRRRRAPWCTLHKKSHWCANTRKTRYQPKK